MKYLKYLCVLVLGALLTFFVMKATQKDHAQEASSTIAYGIERLNKMVVAEQTYANFYSHKSKDSYLGNLISFDKSLLLKVEVKAQASYDLSKMQVKLDSVNQTIYIQKIPPLQIELFPDVDFFEMNQSKMNAFSKDDLNGIKRRAVAEVEKTIDQTSLRKEAHEQLLQNLEEIYLLAKIYHWKIVDETEFAEEMKNRIPI
ncbi:DUF4230 domain-containing protein [Ornithobacterium rhinotracheale]|uniref:DUF4230 domain-containing protein n=1 Tax=Ornithobacterium rhinotracheale TaxID=28251 RepID=UPI00129C3300|nr:DUF4230 domain-containing protein [Ornithobacterium rhinotracheale]MRI62610.1 DUF4230 domain-containing protein [Ornithobacterium rhinotracheale]